MSRPNDAHPCDIAEGRCRIHLCDASNCEHITVLRGHVDRLSRERDALTAAIDEHARTTYGFIPTGGSLVVLKLLGSSAAKYAAARRVFTDMVGG